MPSTEAQTLVDAGSLPDQNAPKSALGRSGKLRISDAALRALKPKGKTYKYSVGDGLYLEVTPTGSKPWRWKYRLNGKENRLAIGSYPEISLSQARDEAKLARKLVKQGWAPAAQRRIDRATKIKEQANTFEAVANE